MPAFELPIDTVVILGPQPWHVTAAVRTAREELVDAFQRWQQVRLSAECRELTDEEHAICDRAVWAELVYAAAVNAALRVQLMT